MGTMGKEARFSTASQGLRDADKFKAIRDKKSSGGKKKKGGLTTRGPGIDSSAGGGPDGTWDFTQGSSL